jgi:hypothetical protein
VIALDARGAGEARTLLERAAEGVRSLQARDGEADDIYRLEIRFTSLTTNGAKENKRRNS